MDKSLMNKTDKMPVLVSPEDIAGMLAVKPAGTAINRITAAVRIYHECQGFRPQTVEAISSKPLENLLQAYQRYLVIGPEWTEVEYGWLPVGTVGIIIIRNVTGEGLQTRPTPQQIKKISEQILLLGVDQKKEHFVVRPKGVPFVAEKDDIGELWLRASEDPVNIELTMIAR